ncbi:N-acetylmuramoyl-L-alanine amidase family protein, partial [Bacillus cereus]|nr:N-acetylmuramoyl-L-alanine amidase family protein [Bacillus cereus]
MEIRKKLVDPSKYGIKCPNTMTPEFITVHNTYNDASAENEISYMIGNNNSVS